MKSAEEIRNIRKRKLEEQLKQNQDRVNEEMLELEKILNEYEDNIEDTKPYVQVPLIIRTKEVKTLLEQMGYYIDKTNQDIPVNTTRIYVDKDSYDIATKRRNHSELLFTTNIPKDKDETNTDDNKYSKQEESDKNSVHSDIAWDGLLGRLILDGILNNKNRGRWYQYES
jgi:hypothetical protein